MISMRTVYVNAVVAAIMMTLVNFGWQAFVDQHWGVALERSWFMALALFVMCLNLKTDSVVNKEDQRG